MSLIGWRSIKIVARGARNTPIALATIWILGGIWILWWPTEVSEREFNEYLFFVIALLGAANIPIGQFPQQKILEAELAGKD
jgi:hypothetical protein